TLDGALLELADALGVELVVQDLELERRELLGAQRGAETSVGHRRRGREVDRPERILGMAGVPLLAEATPQLGLRLHDEARLCASLSGMERALRALHPAAAAQLGCVLAEVPHVPAAV